MFKPLPVGLYLEIALKYKVKQGKNGKFPSNYRVLSRSQQPANSAACEDESSRLF